MCYFIYSLHQPCKVGASILFYMCMKELRDESIVLRTDRDVNPSPCLFRLWICVQIKHNLQVPCAPSSSLSLGPWILSCLKIGCWAGYTPIGPAASKLSRNALAESTVWNPSPEIKHSLAITSSKEVSAQRLMVTMISVPRGEAILAPWWDGNDREGI